MAGVVLPLSSDLRQKVHERLLPEMITFMFQMAVCCYGQNSIHRRNHHYRLSADHYHRARVTSSVRTCVRVLIRLSVISRECEKLPPTNECTGVDRKARAHTFFAAIMDHQEHTIQCHYDVLAVARDADAATIKKAHRKLALKVSLMRGLNSCVHGAKDVDLTALLCHHDEDLCL